MEWSAHKLYGGFKLVFLFYCFASDHMPQALMDTVLPGLLRARDCNVVYVGGSVLMVNTTTPDNRTQLSNFTYNNIAKEVKVCDKGSRKDDNIEIAVIAALFHVPMLMFGIPGGWLVSKSNPNWVYASARFVTGLGSLTFGFFPTSNILLYSYPVIYGIGWVLSEVSLYHILAVTFPKDSTRSRVLSFGYTITALGYVLGYIMGTQFFALHGVVTFLILGAMDLNVGAFYALIAFKNKENEERDHLLSKMSAHSGSVLSSPLALLCYLQNFSIYYTFRVIAVTAPYWLQNELKMTVTDNGLTFGVPSVVHVAIMICIVFFVSTNNTRWAVIMLFILTQAVGFLCYPFVRKMSQAMAADTATRACKLVIMALSPSLLFHIADEQGLGPYGQISGSFAATRHAGSICGSIFSGLLVVALGFRNLCIITGTFLIPLALSTVAFAKLP